MLKVNSTVGGSWKD